jgi:ligand-binding SRPBCC domain-containing protein
VPDLELERRQIVPTELDATFAFFASPWNLEAITPPWLRFEILEAPARLHRGATLRYRLRLFGVPIHWRTEIEAWRPPRTFADRQVRGPYLLWLHTHRFRATPDGTELYDHVRYRVPGGPFAPHALVARWLAEIFDYRAARLHGLLSGSSA